MPQLCEHVIINHHQLVEICIPFRFIQHKIYEDILHFTMLEIFGTSIACRTGRLFKIFSIQLELLKTRLESNQRAIISSDNLPHAIRMCIFLRHQYFSNAHLCELRIRKWRVPRYCELFYRLYLLKQDLKWGLGLYESLASLLDFALGILALSDRIVGTVSPSNIQRTCLRNP